MITAEKRQVVELRGAVFVGLPAPGEIGRDEIMTALRRAGKRAAQIRMKAAAAWRASRDRVFD
jgi:hypothetical protein